MKKHVISAALIITILLTLAACADSPPTSAPPPTGTPAATPAQTATPAPETTQPSRQNPPPLPEEEWKNKSAPFLIKLEPYLDGFYTDGYNTFFFEDDGTVLMNNHMGWGDQQIIPFNKKELPEKPLDNEALREHPEFIAACEKAAELSDEIYADSLKLAHRDGDTWYLYYDYPVGGGSGESYWIDDETVFVKVGPNGEFEDYGTLKAAHIVFHEDYFYYVELLSGITFTPGLGRVKRVDMNGENVQTVVEEIVYGTFQIVNDRVYYTSFADGHAYSVTLDGEDKIAVGDLIVPFRHRVGLEFYGDLIISRYWIQAGYSYGSVGVLPVSQGYASPAIMDKNGKNILTFPEELCGYNAYEVINWGGDEYYNEEPGWGYYFLFLRSNLNGSYWVYEKLSNQNVSDESYDWAWASYEWATVVE